MIIGLTSCDNKNHLSENDKCSQYRSFILNKFDKKYDNSSKTHQSFICNSGILPSKLKFLIDNLSNLSSMNENQKILF